MNQNPLAQGSQESGDKRELPEPPLSRKRESGSSLGNPSSSAGKLEVQEQASQMVGRDTLEPIASEYMPGIGNSSKACGCQSKCTELCSCWQSGAVKLSMLQSTCIAVAQSVLY